MLVPVLSPRPRPVYSPTLGVLFSGSVRVLTLDYSGSRSSVGCCAPTTVSNVTRRVKGRSMGAVCWVTIVVLSASPACTGDGDAGVRASGECLVLWVCCGLVGFAITNVFSSLASSSPLRVPTEVECHPVLGSMMRP